MYEDKKANKKTVIIFVIGVFILSYFTLKKYASYRMILRTVL